MFQVEETIDAPVAAVWRHLSDPALMTAWMDGVDAMKSADGEPLKAGSQLTFTARGAERRSDRHLLARQSFGAEQDHPASIRKRSCRLVSPYLSFQKRSLFATQRDFIRNPTCHRIISET